MFQVNQEFLPLSLSESRGASHDRNESIDDVSERNQSEKSKIDEPVSHGHNFSFNAIKPNFFLDGVNDPQQRQIIQNVENRINKTGVKDVNKNIENLRKNTNNIGAFFRRPNFGIEQSDRESVKQAQPQLHSMFERNSQQNESMRLHGKSSSSNSGKKMSIRSHSIQDQRNSGSLIDKSSSSEDGRSKLRRGKREKIDIQSQFGQIKNQIENVSDTIHLCYIASRHGLKYRNILNYEEEKQEQINKQKTPPPEQSKKLEQIPRQLNSSRYVRSGLEEEKEEMDSIIKNQPLKKLMGRKALQNTQKTKIKKIRGHIGPKPLNNYDRQQINQFMDRIVKQNFQSRNNLIYVNDGIHQLLRGAQTPSVIQEEENEASQSNFQNNCSFDQMSLVGRNKYVLSNGFLAQNMSGYSSLIDQKQFIEPSPYENNMIQSQKSKKKRDTNTSSMFNFSNFNRSSINHQNSDISKQDDSNLSIRSRSNFSDISRLQKNIDAIENSQQPIFIVVKNEGSSKNDKNLSKEQIDQALKKYRELSLKRKKSLKNSSSSASRSGSSGRSFKGIDVCKISIDANDQMSMVIQQIPGLVSQGSFRFQQKFGAKISQGGSSGGENEIDENPNNPNRGGINLASNSIKIIEEYEFEGSSLNNQRIRRNGSSNSVQPVKQGINLMNKTANFQNSRIDSESSLHQSQIPKRNSSQGQIKESSIKSSGSSSIIIDKDEFNPFISGRRLKNKASEKQFINKLSKSGGEKDIQAIQRLLEEEKNLNAPNESLISKLSKNRGVHDLEEINEEDHMLSQSKQLDSSQVEPCSDRQEFLNQLAHIVDNSSKEKEQEDKDFIKKAYLKQQTKLNLKMKYIPDEVIDKDSDSFGESYHFSSSSEDEVIKKMNQTPNPATANGRKLQVVSNADSSQLTEPLNYLDDSQQGTGDILKCMSDSNQEIEELYNYNPREKKLMTKVIKLMKPARQNQIWNNVFMRGEEQEQQDVYKAIDRMAFERDPSRQIKVSMLDYNSLDQYYGPIIFVDGMTEIKFNGKRVVEKDRKSATCAGFLKSQLRNFNNLNISQVELQSIPLSSIMGLVYGPKSISFKQYLKNNFRNQKIMQERCDQWRFISIITTFQSYDFIMDSIEDSYDLIISINEALIKQNEQELRNQSEKIQKMSSKQALKKWNQINEANPITELLYDDELEAFKKKWVEQLKSEIQWQNQVMKFSTRKKIIKFQMLRMKIIHIAEELGYTMSQYFMITIYNTICGWPEDTIQQVDEKLKKLKQVMSIIKRHRKLSELLEVIDSSTQKRLQRDIHKKRLLQIMNMSEEERQNELKSFFMSHSLFGMRQNEEEEEEQIEPCENHHLSVNNWKNWLTQKTKNDENIPKDEIKVSLQKKIRSIKYLEHLKQKRQKRIDIEEQLKKVESRGSKKVKNFFNKGLMSLIKQKHSGNCPHLENFNGNEFNYYQLTKEVLHKKKYEIIKWTKSLYSKENRMIQQQQKPKRYNENMLNNLKQETDKEIIFNQDLISQEIKLISRSGCMSDYRAVPMTSIFDLSTGLEPKQERDLKQLDELRMQRQEQLKSQEDSLTVDQYLALRSKDSRIANTEWKYEYKRQQNLLRKVIEVSLMKKEFDSLPEDEKRKRVVNMLVEDQKSQAKNYRNLMNVERESQQSTSNKPKELSSSGSSCSGSSSSSSN